MFPMGWKIPCRWKCSISGWKVLALLWTGSFSAITNWLMIGDLRRDVPFPHIRLLIVPVGGGQSQLGLKPFTLCYFLFIFPLPNYFPHRKKQGHISLVPGYFLSGVNSSWRRSRKIAQEGNPPCCGPSPRAVILWLLLNLEGEKKLEFCSWISHYYITFDPYHITFRISQKKDWSWKGWNKHMPLASSFIYLPFKHCSICKPRFPRHKPCRSISHSYSSNTDKMWIGEQYHSSRLFMERQSLLLHCSY